MMVETLPALSPFAAACLRDAGAAAPSLPAWAGALRREGYSRGSSVWDSRRRIRRRGASPA